MSGLVKAKKYDWTDSNLALFGSDTEKQVKKESAETEPAWTGAGEAPGMQIWRIVKFKVTHWPKEDYGKFYDGDSYIILNTYKEDGNDALLYDVHFWIGADSSQDEYGTAAYKTVELDTLLDDKPVQHREVMNHESDLFKGYFKRLEMLKGGADSGFRKVKPEEYKPRLLHIHGDKKSMNVQERPLNKACVTSDDVFILDLGERVYQFNGKESNKNERFRAAQYMTDLKSERSGRITTEILEEDDLEDAHDFYEQLDNHNEDMADDVDEGMNGAADEEGYPVLFRLSDSSGEMDFQKVAEGSIQRTLLDKNDVFILDGVKEVFVWIGNRASKAEKQNAMTHAHNYLSKTNHPLAQISVFKQGSEKQAFWNCFH